MVIHKSLAGAATRWSRQRHIAILKPGVSNVSVVTQFSAQVAGQELYASGRLMLRTHDAHVVLIQHLVFVAVKQAVAIRDIRHHQSLSIDLIGPNADVMGKVRRNAIPLRRGQLIEARERRHVDVIGPIADSLHSGSFIAHQIWRQLLQFKRSRGPSRNVHRVLECAWHQRSWDTTGDQHHAGDLYATLREQFSGAANSPRTVALAT